jgi:SAM-dependent methyltransferase
MERNMANVVALASSERAVGRMLDLGCNAGVRTSWIAEHLGATEVYGVEIDEERGRMAASKGIRVTVTDLNGPLPFDDGFFDLVVSNQVIEHLWDTDNFVAECFRVLRPGSVSVISTENLSGWHNIAAQILGWQPFSLTNVSMVSAGLGNPAAIHRGEQGQPRGHVRVFAYRGLSELFAIHGFAVVELRGAGYFPLPAALARLDRRHAAFLTIKARRPTSAMSVINR